jgi:hypothetical protein
MRPYLFPRWSDRVFPVLVLGVLGPAATMAILGFWYYGTDKHLAVGYQPVQPVEYSHKLHAGDMGLDCRYCHYTVEKSGFAAVPPTQVCLNCHSKVKQDSPALLAVRESAATGAPVPWVRVHRVPDYVYFDHSAHVAAGVGCSTCHGRVDRMVRVTQREPLTMGWCLDCHRNPAPNLRPASEITNMDWTPPAVPAQPPVGATGRVVHPPTDCSGCHR